MVRPTLPAPFTGTMDGESASIFVHQFGNYFIIVKLNDDLKIGQIEIMLLEGTAYNWFSI